MSDIKGFCSFDLIQKNQKIKTKLNSTPKKRASQAEIPPKTNKFIITPYFDQQRNCQKIDTTQIQIKYDCL